MVQLIACFSLGSLEKYGSSPECDKVDDAQMRHLLNIDFDSLVKHGVMWRHASMGANSDENGDIDQSLFDSDSSSSQDDSRWTGLRHMRGHILVMLLFHMFKKYGPSMGKGSWLAVTKVLLWARKKKILPDELTELDDFSNARGGALPLSIYAVQCEKRIMDDDARQRAARQLMESNREASLWESVASLGGLLWAPGGTPPVSGGAVSSQGMLSLPQGELTERSLLMLEQCLIKSGIENLLFSWTKDISDSGLCDVVWCLLAEVVGASPAVMEYISAVEGTYAGKHKQRLEQFFQLTPLDGTTGTATGTTSSGGGGGKMLQKDYPKEKRSAAEIVEIEAVTVLEWVSRIVFVNRYRSANIWPIVHGACRSLCALLLSLCVGNGYHISSLVIVYVCVEFLNYVLESNVDDISTSCPFLIERAVVAVISAVIHLMRDPSESGTNSAQSSALAAMPGPSGHTSSASLWTSLGLLREVPHAVMANIADRLGAGLVTFIR
jgi:hypothetical protein